ncbi:MAG: DUF4383 domain-containing protein [Pseudonocardia sp.]|uniref:DUF4383 domain-containing protein n=1 Tax=unclassified Pseudonocardia TaxID=2619320 RepID=UPI00086BDD1C|nr:MULTISPECIES: DUF4383 domain-containing protein [unclassified Pseudonocardia]MBN9112008.1 DUF4383 domain-containing protein [Pseudonocardia sp.]ODU25979.1 MAG: hypothetical protein ABS80_08465 [Pseudonocardia sp. SCN 72-51]ODV06066.1 MAG: hypothetical protein ABT15_14750 [Pseudonocardia sp. SCN 73-27]
MSTPRTGAAVGTRRPVQIVAAVFGVVFLLVGVLGFVPGVTTNYDQLQFAGHESGALLLGLFAVSVLHNIVHLLFGIAGLALARRPDTARNYLVYGGIVYAVLWIYGLVIDHGSDANFVPLNTADNWLHLVLAVAMIALGVVLGREVSRSTRTA